MTTEVAQAPRPAEVTPSELPFVSVVVPTRNRAPYLGMLLNALTLQAYSSSRMEVIVIDNSSTDGTEEVVSAARQTAPFRLTYIRKKDEGPAASRNLGASLAVGELLAFTDSDCMPLPGWLRIGVSGFKPGIGLVCGPILPVGLTRESPFFMHQMHQVSAEDGLYPTANVFYRRSVFMALGGFDESSRTYPWGQPVGGDDTEMGWRVKRNGYRSAFASGAIVLHQASPVRPRAYILQTSAAQVIPSLVARFPELRRTSLWQRFFIHKESASFYPFLLGLLMLRRTRLGAPLMLPWLMSTWPALRFDSWPPRRWGRMALRFVLKVQGQVLLSVSLLYGSIKSRKVVL